MGLEISTEAIFERQDIELSRTKIIKGKIEFNSGLIYLGKKQILIIILLIYWLYIIKEYKILN